MSFVKPKRAASSGVSEEAVRWAYRIALGREPESEAVVRAHREAAMNIDQLRAAFFSSEEFRTVAPRRYSVAPTANAPAPDIRYDDRPELRERLFRHIAKSWSHYGETEPHWSVVTFDRYRPGTLAENLDEFDRSGETPANFLFASAARNRVTLPVGGTCIELGCGVGRITRWLAPHFAKVIALDVSPGHLAIAKEHVGRYAGNVEFRHVRSLDDLDALPEAEAFFTYLVLQHNPPPVIESVLDRIYARLAHGAVAFVHVPTHIPDYRFDLEQYLAAREQALDMEMHMIPQRDLFRLAERHGMSLLEVINETNPENMTADRLLMVKS